MSNICETSECANARGNSSQRLKPGGSLPLFAELWPQSDEVSFGGHRL